MPPSLQAINGVIGTPAMASCFFEGATPLNGYEADFSALKMSFLPGQGYEKKEGASADIAILCEGVWPREGVPQSRYISVRDRRLESDGCDAMAGMRRLSHAWVGRRGVTRELH